MAEKKAFLKSQFGNKGFVLSLDAAVAISIVIVMLVVASFYVSRAEDSLPKLQMIKTASDILAVLDNKGTLQTLDQTLIKDGVNSLLPPAYDVKLNINCTSMAIPIIVETGTDPPAYTFVAAGKRFFVKTTPNYCVAKFWIWLK